MSHIFKKASAASAVMALALALALAPGMALAADEPVSDDPFADAVQVELADGEYSVDVAMEGGSGKASIASPAGLLVQDGKAVSRVQWSSEYYDYMLVAGKKYLPVNEGGNSVFEIPVLAMDEPFTVVGDTTAMSTPHEIEYTLSVDSSSVVEGAPIAGAVADESADAAAGAEPTDEQVQSSKTLWMIICAAVVLIGLGVLVGGVRGRRSR